MATIFNEDNTIEQMMLSTLQKNGWKYIPAEELPRMYSDVLVEPMVKEALIRLNPEIAEDPSRADEVIYNLCDNAIRYNKKNGTVKVRVDSEQGHSYLRVEDTGIGIPKEHQKRIFERFYRVDKSRSKQTGGTGLGLAIVKHIVALHDAKLDLQSEVGKGTTITVTF